MYSLLGCLSLRVAGCQVSGPEGPDCSGPCNKKTREQRMFQIYSSQKVCEKVRQSASKIEISWGLSRNKTGKIVWRVIYKSFPVRAY
jgi:hypothetical protein